MFLNPKVAWLVPSMSDEQRVAIKSSLFVSRTDDGGKTWQNFRAGLPQKGCFDIVYRHALANNGDELVFGTTCGNLFYSADRGVHRECLNHYLPMVYSAHFSR